MATADKEAPDRLLTGPLKSEHGTDLKRGEQPQALGGRADLLVSSPLREQQPHLGVREVAPAPADLAEELALPALPDQRLDESRVGDDAGMIQIFSKAQASPRDRGGRPVVAVPRTAAEMLPEQPVGAAGFNKAFGVPVLGHPVDDPVRVGLESFQAPGGPEPRFLELAEERGFELQVEEYATGLQKLASAGGVHNVIIGEVGPEVASKVTGTGCCFGTREGER